MDPFPYSCITQNCQGVAVPGESFCESCKLGVPPPTPLDTVLKERGEKYGDFGEESARVLAAVGLLTPDAPCRVIDAQSVNTVKHALHMIVTKLVRARTSPLYQDHWRDIAGYATLVLRHLEQQQAGEKPAPQEEKHHGSQDQ